MSEVRNKDNYEQWIKFFLRAIAESSDEAVDTIKKLSELHNKNVELISNMKASKSAHIIFSYLENNPIIDIRKTAEELGMVVQYSFRYSKSSFEEKGILKQANNASRNRVFAYEDYLEILRKDTI